MSQNRNAQTLGQTVREDMTAGRGEDEPPDRLKASFIGRIMIDSQRARRFSLGKLDH